MRATCGVAAMLFGTSLQAQTLTPQDFAFGQTVMAVKEAAAYRLALPLSVYQNTFREDLPDLRIFNAEGIAVPFSLSRAPPQPLTHTDSVALPMFPLPEGARILIDGVHLTINSAGSAVNLQTQNGTPDSVSVRSYLLDARTREGSLSALQLIWPDAAQDYAGRLRVEVSDDLAVWRPLVTGAPIANLHANGQSLIENRAAFAPTAAKFWRISWMGAAPGLALTQVLAESAGRPTEALRETLEVSTAPEPSNEKEYRFDLGAHPPVSRLNVVLPDDNTVIDMAIDSRASADAPWRMVLRSGFYRFKSQGVEQNNAALELNPDTDRFWRSRILGAGLSSRAPMRLQVQWIPDELTFLAQGRAPYTLLYGATSAQRAQSDLSHLPSSLEIARATVGPVNEFGGPARLVPKPVAFPRTRAALWGVLLLAVGLLAFMALRLSREARV